MYVIFGEFGIFLFYYIVNQPHFATNHQFIFGYQALPAKLKTMSTKHNPTLTPHNISSSLHTTRGFIYSFTTPNALAVN